MKWLYLAIAIVAEILATSALKKTVGFTHLGPSLFTGVVYAIAIYFLSLTLREIPIGIAYAIWCGVGIVLVSVIGTFVFKQRLDAPAIIGITLILAGVVIMNVFSKASVD